MPTSNVVVTVTITTTYDLDEFTPNVQADFAKAFVTAGMAPPTMTVTGPGPGAPKPPADPAPIPMPPPAPTPAPTPPAAKKPAIKGRSPAKPPPPVPPVDDTGLADSDPDPTPTPIPVETQLDPVDLDVAGDDAEADDDQDALGLGGSSMTGQDALEAGLGKARVLFANGHKASVKDIQKKFNVASFKDITPTQGHELLAMVIKLEEQLGLRV